MMRRNQTLSTTWTPHAVFVAAVNLGNFRTILVVPMIKDNKVIGLIAIYRNEVKAFTDKQIALVENFANPLRMLDPGTGFKLYPSNGFTQRPIDAALSLRAEHDIRADDIERVQITHPRFDYVNRPQPKSGLDGMATATSVPQSGTVWRKV